MAAKPFPQCLLLLLLLWFLSPLPVLFFLFHSLNLVFVVGLFYSPTYADTFEMQSQQQTKPKRCRQTPHHHPLLIWPAMFRRFWPYKLHVCLGEYSFQCLFSFFCFCPSTKAATDTKKKSHQRKPNQNGKAVVLVAIMDKLFCRYCFCNHNLLSSTHTHVWWTICCCCRAFLYSIFKYFLIVLSWLLPQLLGVPTSSSPSSSSEGYHFRSMADCSSQVWVLP